METLYLYILLLGLAWSIFNKYFITKIRNLPPTPWSALTVIGFRTFFKQPMHQTLFQIAKRHGPILLLRFGCRRVLLVSTAAAAEDLYTSNDVAFANRPKLLPAMVFGGNCTNLAWAPHGAHWRHLRRVCCLEVLPFHRQPDQNHSLADEIKRLISHLSCNNQDAIELRPMFQELMFNVMMRMFAGKRYCQKETIVDGEENESISLLEYAIQSFRTTTGCTDLVYFMPILKLFGVTGLEQRCRKLQRKGDSLMKNLIKEIRENSLEEKVIQFLLERQKEDPKRYTDEIISALVLELLSAGTDTSAAILEWAFALLLNHPEVLKKAQNEIDKHVGNDRFLEHSDIEHLPYLRCIVKEAIRLYPVAPFLVPHESSKDCKVGGYYVPKGTMLMVNVWAVHNDPNIWSEPSKFNPERFEDIIDERNGFKFIPFGYGRRSCPGKHMAVRVITMALGSLIHCFNWERVCEVDFTVSKGLALLKEKPLTVVCRPRSEMDNLFSQI